MSNLIEHKEHLNLPQLLAHAVNANTTAVTASRASGKSLGIVAPRIIHCAKVMPRSLGTFLSPSFRKFTDHLWPGIKKGFTEKFKLIEDRDFVFFKRPPEKWKLANGQVVSPYTSPGSYERCITFPNGSSLMVISQDPGQTSNGLDTDYNITDEAKLIDGERAQEETYNTLRGNRDKFGHLAEHYSKWILSDKYILDNSKQSTWWVDYKKLHDPSLIAEILIHQLAISKCDDANVKNHLLSKLVLLQKKCVNYIEANILDNIHAVGIEYLEQLAKTNSPYGILTSLFNMDVKRSEGNSFYPLFSEYKHTYGASNDSKVTSLIERHGHDYYLENRTSDLDTDVIHTQKLIVTFDLGGKYNWALVGQKQGNVHRWLKDFMVEKPKLLKDLIHEICLYYRNHKHKEVRLLWGLDADNEQPDEAMTHISRITEYFSGNGWVVIDGAGHARRISHSLKYTFGEKVFDTSQHRDERFPMVIFNSSNCARAIWSMSEAKLVPGEIKRKKDKRGEKNINLPQWQQPHLSDAHDWLIIDYLDYLTDGEGYSVSLLR